MNEFFRSWRRKIGCVTLVMACVVMGWRFRSDVRPDFVAIPFDINFLGRTLEGLGTEKGSLVVYVQGRVNHLADGAYPEIVPPADSDSTTPDQSSTDQEAESQNVPLPPVEAKSIVIEWLRAEPRRLDPPSEIDLSRQGVWLSMSAESLEPVRSRHTYITCYFPEPEPLFTFDLGWIVLPLTLLSAYLLLVPVRKQPVAASAGA